MRRQGGDISKLSFYSVGVALAAQKNSYENYRLVCV